MLNSECTKCPLREGCNQVVCGIGLPTAKIMIVGEFPNKEDDLMGEPFSDIEGKLIKKLLEQGSIHAQDCYFCYAVRCMPPSRKDVKRLHIDTCKRWLSLEIEQLKPQIIITLGQIPTSLLLKKNLVKLSSVVGGFYNSTFNLGLICPWYSASYVFRSGKKVDKKTIEYFKEISKRVQSA